MSGAHTSGRMSLESDGTSIGLGGQVVIVCPAPDGAPIVKVRANAARIVACWNACEGLSTEALERLGTLDRARVDLDVVCVRAIAQRDELLEALKLCAAVCSGEIMSKQGLIDALKKASAAIAKVEWSA